MTAPIRLNDTIVARRLLGLSKNSYTATGDVVRLTYKASGEELRVLYRATDGDGRTVHIRESKIVRVERSGKVVWRKTTAFSMTSFARDLRALVAGSALFLVVAFLVARHYRFV
jgi:hypothetical protein